MVTSITNDHKVIRVKSSKILTNKLAPVLEELNKTNNVSDLFFNWNNKNIVLSFTQLNLNAFKTKIQKLATQYKLNGEASLLSQIVSDIEKVGNYGVKGGKRIFVGFNSERKVKNRKAKEKDRGKFFYANNHSFSDKNTVLPKQFVNKIVTADSESFLKKLPTNSIDLIFTSPPYNFGVEYESSHDGIDWNKYFKQLFAIFDECIRVLKYGGRIIINVQPLFSDYIPIHHMISNHFLEKKLIWKGEIIWEKNNYNCKYTAWGSWKSPSSPYLKYTWEFLEVFSKGTLIKKGKKENIDISAEEFKKWVVAKWPIAPERRMKEFDHPAMFPEALTERVIKLFSFKDDVVLDPFNGVGTTTLVAAKLDRKYLGIDISKEYSRKARERIRNLHVQGKLL